jgi:hypothetical protein
MTAKFGTEKVERTNVFHMQWVTFGNAAPGPAAPHPVFVNPYSKHPLYLPKSKGGVIDPQHREAVREKNERVLKERMVFLSEALAAQSLAENQAMDTATGDGLA